MTEKTSDDLHLWGIPVQYIFLIAIMVAVYFFDSEFKSRSVNVDPKTVQILERLTSIEQQLNYLDGKIDNKIDMRSSDFNSRIQELERWRYKIERDENN
jgi:hypothetical protein